MEQVRYMISDAANIVAVESHVLRYWEDELELTVPRNEMGHRYYTQENVDQFLRIKELKEKGYQLKAIKIMLQQGQGTKNHVVPVAKTATPAQPARTEVIPAKSNPEERMAQFQELMTQIVRNAMTDNNKDLSKEIGTEVGDRVLKEMNYLMREQDEQSQERYRKLDEAIRNYGKKARRTHQKKERVKLTKKVPSAP